MRLPINICFFLILILSISCRSRSTDDFDSENEMIKDAMAQVDSKLEYRNDLLLSAYEDENRRISIPFSVKKPDILVLKVSFQNCDMCFDEVMTTIIKEHWNKKINLEVWINSDKIESNLSHKSWYDKGDRIFFRNIKYDLGTKLKSEKLNKPYFFIFNSADKRVSHIFFPELGNTGNTKKYLSIIQAKFPVI